MANNRPSAWTQKEQADCVASYFAMLQKELAGEPYNKAKARRELHALLDGKSEGSIEFKHMNISAILQTMGLPHIAGYKPLSNFQNSLYDAVVDALGTADFLKGK